MKFFVLIARFFQSLLGQFNYSYSPPAWVSKIRTRLANSKLGAWLERRRDWVRANPKRARLTALGVVASIALVWGGTVAYLRYLDSLPKPDYVTVSLSTPKEPDLETRKPQKLLVQFSRSAARIEALNKPITTGVSLTPAIAGTWRWSTDSTLEFAPDEVTAHAQWEIGQKYKIKLTRALFPDHVLLENLEYDFETPQLKASVTKREFYQDPRDPQVKKAVVNLRYNYVLDTEDFKKRVTLSMRTKDASTLGQSGKAIPFAVTFGTIPNEAYILSENIAIPREDSVVDVTIGEGVRTPKGGKADKLEAFIDIPGLLNLFKFEEPEVSFARNEKFEPEQILVLTTRAGVATETIAKTMKLYLLPKKKKGDEKSKRNSYWSSPSEVPDYVSKLEPVNFTVVPSAEENSTMHTFKVDIPVGRYVYMKVPAGMKSFGGYELAKDFEGVTGVPEYPKELMVMSQGSVLSLSGDKKIPLLGRNVKKVKFQLYRVIPSQLNQFVYHNYQSTWTDFAKPAMSIPKETVSEIFSTKMDVPFNSPAATQYFSLDLEPYLAKDGGSKKGFFYLRVEGEGMSDERAILMTDLGIVAKTNNDTSHDIFVQNLRTGAPIAGAEVEVIGVNGLTILEQKTNAEGRASFPSLSTFSNEKRPIAYVVRQGGDFSFLPYEMESRSLGYSQFDVGGLLENKSGDALSAYMFSDRGIYRPGDEVNVGLMVRSHDWKKMFAGLPLSWAVTDPRGAEIKREKLAVGSTDLTSLTFGTQDTSPTGVYNIQVFILKKNKIEEQIGSLSVRVEEFLPDRMRVTATLSSQKASGWVSPDELKANVSVKNLFGTPAEDRRVVGELALFPTPAQFRGFDGYQFAALKGDEKSFTEELAILTTDQKGEATFDLDLKRFNKGMWRLRFNAEAYEANGGRGVSATTSTLVSAWPFLVGIKADGALNYINKDSARDLEIIAVDPDLKPIEAKDLKAVIVERKYVSALMKQPDGTYKYQSVMKEITGEAKPFTIAAKGTKFKVPTGQPGDFVLVIKDKTDTELNRIGFTIAGSANLTRSLEKNTELQVALSRPDYKPGDEIEMQIKAPFTGAGLITIERDKVYASKWFKTSTTSTVEKIKIPEGLEGNAYVNVTFLRASDSKEIFMSPLAYAVQPFSIALDEHKIEVSLVTPEKVRPGEKLKVEYSASRPTKIILYGVDEGILQVAQYKKPDPLGFFFQRRALQVRTFQLLDLLLPEYSILQSLSAAGGDMEGAISRNLNPFKRKTEKPVVFWSGVIDASPTKKTYEYEVPDYFNGMIRVMAVASSGAAFGAVEQKSLSRGDYIITSNVPTFVTPGDEFVVGIGLSNQAEGTGDGAQVKLDIEADAFEVVGEKSQTIAVPEGREKATQFRLKAKGLLGSQPIRFKASGGGKSAKASVETSVRPAAPYITDVTAGYAEKPTFEIAAARKLYPEFMKQSAALSPLPIAMGDGLKVFLDQYPFGCSEQLTSKLIPYVVLKTRPEFKIDGKKANEMFAALLTQLRGRQTSNGGFAMYDPKEGDNLPVSLYVAMALIEAKDRGFQVPTDVLEKVVGFLQSGVYRKTGTISEVRSFAQSLYLLARAGQVPGNDVGFLRKVLDQQYKSVWKTDATAAYLASTYKLLKQDDEARAVFAKVAIGTGDIPVEHFYFYDGLVRDTVILTLTARHFPEMLKDKASDKALRAAFAPLSTGHYTTHSAAWSLLALDALVRNAQNVPAFNELAIEEIRDKGEVKPLPLPGNTVMPTVSVSTAAQKVRFHVPASVPFYYSFVQAGFDKEPSKVEVKKSLEVVREYLSDDGKPLTSAKLGDFVKVRLRIRSTASTQLPNVVIVDLLPSGLEPVLEQEIVASETQSDEGKDPNSEEDVFHGDGEGEGEGDGGYEEPPATHESDEGAIEKPSDHKTAALRELFHYFLPAAYAQTAETSVRALVPDYVERREDRMVIYAMLPPGVTEFTYRAKAVAEGTFVTPPAFAESMYDRQIKYRGVSGQFNVEPVAK